MRYQSIIRFFEYAHIDYGVPEDFNAQRAKKLVNAEFAMQPDGIIETEGLSYTKQDLLSELDRPDFADRLKHHKQVWENPPLLDLLEKDKVNLSQKPAWQYLAYAPGFKEFVSPYFAAVFDRVMRSVLSNNNLLNAAIWLDYLQFVAPADQEEALRSTRLYLSDASKFFRNLNDQSYKSREGELYMWHHSNWSAFLNKLPDGLLGYVDELISTIINFTVRIQKSNRTMCYEISKEMLMVTTANTSLLQLIRSNHETYKKNYESRTVKGYFSSVNYIYIIIVVIFWVARIVISNSSSSSSSGNKGEIIYDIKKPAASMQQDQQTVATIQDNTRFTLQRNAYMDAYNKRKQTGFSGADPAAIRNTPFQADKIYLFIEGHNSSVPLDTIGFENLTGREIHLRFMWCGNAYQHSIPANGYAGFAMAKDKNIDFVVDCRPDEAVRAVTPGDFQYIHIRETSEAPYSDITAEIGTPNELPYFLHSELKTAPVCIRITERNGQLYFDIHSLVKVVNMKAATS